jgi:myosin heavy subunit
MSTSKVFIPHEEFVWVTGQIIVDADAKGNVQVKINDELLPNDNKAKIISLTKFGIPSLPQQNIDIPENGVEDMTKLNYLHEPSILDNLKRYEIVLSHLVY